MQALFNSVRLVAIERLRKVLVGLCNVGLRIGYFGSKVEMGYLGESELDSLGKCVDCGKPDPAMHNTRERQGKPVRFVGYLCVDCWIRANPSWQKFNPKPSRPPWGLTALGLALGVLIYLLFLY